MKKLLAILISAAFVCAVYSQVPEKLSYQAVVRNTSGELVKNHLVGVKITILPQAKGITYSETHTVTSNNNGLITIEIGGGTVVYGNFSTIDWSAGPYDLKTEIDPDGGTSYTITGTSPMLTVPYAMYAKSASNGTQWTTSGSNIYYNTGNVGIGLTSPVSKLAIQPSSGWDDNTALFEVRNKIGVPVLAVYNNGVRILVDHTYSKALKGGFAVGGYDQTKAGKTVDFMTISPDSIRFNINNH